MCRLDCTTQCVSTEICLLLRVRKSPKSLEQKETKRWNFWRRPKSRKGLKVAAEKEARWRNRDDIKERVRRKGQDGEKTCCLGTSGARCCRALEPFVSHQDVEARHGDTGGISFTSVAILLTIGLLPWMQTHKYPPLSSFLESESPYTLSRCIASSHQRQGEWLY